MAKMMKKRMGGKLGAPGAASKAGPIATPFKDSIQKSVSGKK
jgi:hypothetical protein